MPNNEPAQNSLDLRYTAVFGVGRKLAHQQASASSKKYRKEHEEDVLDDISSTHAANSHGSTPRIPVMTSLLFLDSPTTKALVQVEPPISINIMTITRLEICQPITRHVDKGCNTSAQYAGSNQNDPDLTCIRQLLDMAKYTTGTRV